MVSKDGINQAAAVNVVMVKKGVYFICDTAVTINPTAEQIAENTLLATETVKRFGITPRVALLSFSNGDDIASETSKKMASAMEIIMKQSSGIRNTCAYTCRCCINRRYTSPCFTLFQAC